jgi:AraC-like DNA-binding protein
MTNNCHLNFNIFNSIILAGVIQGFVFGLVVLTNKKFRNPTNNFLAWLIVVYSLSNLQYYLIDIELFTRDEFYASIFVQWALLMPALLLFYGRNLIGKPLSKLARWLYAIPFLLSTIQSSHYKILEQTTELDDGFIEYMNISLAVSEYLAMLYNIGVIIYLLVAITRYRRQQTFKAQHVDMKLNWFSRTLFLIGVVTLVWAIQEATFESGSSYDYFYPLWILIAVLIYWLGHLGIYKYGINEERKKIRKTIYNRYSISEVLPGKSEHITSLENYLKTERNFLNPNISLDEIANHLNLSTGHLSKIINTELGMSFKDYLNNLRVEEAKRNLKDPEFSNYTLVAIGLEAGFNSKSAFNASFKKITGLTPSQFRSQQG